MTAISATESRRFRLRVARAVATSFLEVGSVVEILRDDDPDVLIVRAPADDPAIAATLAQISGYVTLTADMLMYWQWNASSLDEPRPGANQTVPTTDAAQIAFLVGAVFEGYTNHYAANPLLAAQDALDGYVEWAQTLVNAGATCVVLHAGSGEPTGFGLIDWVEPVPDVRLAGILPHARGKGAYRDLIAHLMRTVRDHGGSALRISTQAHNTGVMRAWAEAGWRPISTQVTFHMIRSELLPQRVAEVSRPTLPI